MINTAGVRGGAQRVAPHVSAADRAYAYAKSAILSRQVGPHDLLTEGELADAVGVSRTPVREALLRLQAEGLIRLLPKRGALVLPVTADEIADVLETRRLIETFAVRKAIAAARADLIGRLEALLHAMRDAARAGDPRRYAEADRDFHAAIVAATGNAILIQLYASLRDRQLRMGVVNLVEQRDPEAATSDTSARQRMRASIADHEVILEAIRARTVRAAEAAVTAHLNRAEEQLTRH
jgi:DNA-binding GntR family transcriptional regulator